MNALTGNAKPKLTRLNDKGPLPVGAGPPLWIRQYFHCQFLK